MRHSLHYGQGGGITNIHNGYVVCGLITSPGGHKQRIRLKGKGIQKVLVKSNYKLYVSLRAFFG